MIIFDIFLNAEARKLRRFELALGYVFSDRRLLKRALTHKSFANEFKLGATEQNERYEFLGDAVLDLAISELLMQRFPEHAEGDLSQLRAALVNERSLATIARALQLGGYLFLGKGEELCQGRGKDSLLADAIEAVIGAIYLDGGFKRCLQVIQKHFKTLVSDAAIYDLLGDYKTRLQEICLTKYHSMPQYKLVNTKGPDHDKSFEVHLYVQGRMCGKGKGKSKKRAEQEAAKEALESWELAS